MQILKSKETLWAVTCGSCRKCRIQAFKTRVSPCFPSPGPSLEGYETANPPLEKASYL